MTRHAPAPGPLHFGLGTLYRQMGWGEEAHAALSTAMALYRTMDMPFWLPQVEAVLAQTEAR